MATDLTREELMAAFDEAVRRHKEIIDSIPRERMVEPGATDHWSVKDVLAHLGGWRAWTIARLEAAKTGEIDAAPHWPAELNEGDQPDKVNEWIYTQHRDDTLDQVIADWYLSFDRVRSAVAALPDEMIYTTDYFPWFEGFALSDALKVGFLGHFHEEHEQILRDWLASQND